MAVHPADSWRTDIKFLGWLFLGADFAEYLKTKISGEIENYFKQCIVSSGGKASKPA